MVHHIFKNHSIAVILLLTNMPCPLLAEADPAVTGGILDSWNLDIASSNTTMANDSDENNGIVSSRGVTTSTVVPDTETGTLYLAEETTELKATTTSTPVSVSTSVESPYYPLEIVTCKGKCGQTIDVPCSCDVRCLVHGNCCENMTSDCPEILDEARSKFDALLRSDVVCSKDGYFMISSCPRNGGRSGEETPTMRNSTTIQLSSTSSTGDRSTPETQLADIIGHDMNSSSNLNENRATQNTTLDLIEFLQVNTPVVDWSTGFVFANEDISRCHGVHSPNLLFFHVMMPALAPIENPFPVERLEKALSREHVSYIPPPSFPNDLDAVSPCIPKAIDECPTSKTETYQDLLELCRSFISYVGVGKGYVFANRFCYECSMVYRPEVKPTRVLWPASKTPNFSVSFKLSESQKIRIVSSTRVGSFFPWKDVTCSFDTVTAATSQVGQMHRQEVYGGHSVLKGYQGCTVESCSTGYHLRPDGSCKTLHEVSMAFADDGFLFSSSELNRLPPVVSCFLDNIFGIEMANEWKPTEIVFDTRLNKHLYLVKVGAFLPHHNNQLFVVDFKKQYSKLSAMAKTFREQRKGRLGPGNKWSLEDTRHLDSPKPTDTDNPCLDNTASNGNDECRVIKSSDMMQTYTALKTYSARGELLDNTTTTICCITNMSGRDIERLPCWEDCLHEMDVALVEDFTKSHCMALFHDNMTSGEKLLILPTVTWTLMVVVAVMVLVDHRGL